MEFRNDRGRTAIKFQGEANLTDINRCVVCMCTYTYAQCILTYTHSPVGPVIIIINLQGEEGGNLLILWQNESNDTPETYTLTNEITKRMLVFISYC